MQRSAQRSFLGRAGVAVTSLALLVGACGGATQVSTAGSGEVVDVDTEVNTPAAPPEASPTGASEPTPTAPTPTATPGTGPDGNDARPASDAELDELLLTARDLGGAHVVGPMSFGDEPQYVFDDCDAMGTVFAAHGGEGRRVRAELGEASLRMSAVDLGDPAVAGAVLDATDSVWETCPLATTDLGDTWWIEPIDMPVVDGWRTSGLAMGVSPTLVWTAGWYQRGSVVVFADLDAANPWDLRAELDAAISARLVGDIDPVDFEPPRIAPTPTVTPPGPDPTPSPFVEPAPDSEWLDHPAARYVPEASFFGDGWTRELDQVNEAAPSDPTQALEECDDLAAPPTMDGLEVDYRSPEADWAPDVELLVGVGDEAAAIATVAAFVGLGECGTGSFDDVQFWFVDVTSPLADEVVVLEFRDAQSGTLGRFAIARYGADVVGIAYGGFMQTQAATIPEAATLVAWLDQWAESG